MPFSFKYMWRNFFESGAPSPWPSHLEPLHPLLQLASLKHKKEEGSVTDDWHICDMSLSPTLVLGQATKNKWTMPLISSSKSMVICIILSYIFIECMSIAFIKAEF